MSQVTADLELNKEKVSELEETLSPMRREIVSLSERLSDARLETARLSERLAYTDRMVSARKQEISASSREDASSMQRIHVARVAAEIGQMSFWPLCIPCPMLLLWFRRA